jgi:hypothetical protein
VAEQLDLFPGFVPTPRNTPRGPQLDLFPPPPPPGKRKKIRDVPRGPQRKLFPRYRPLRAEEARVARRRAYDLFVMSCSVCAPDPGPPPDAERVGSVRRAADGSITVLPPLAVRQ